MIGRMFGVIVCVMMLTGCIGTIQYTPIQEVKGFDLTGKWNFRFTGIYANGGNTFSSEGIMTIQKVNEKYSGVGVQQSLRHPEYGNITQDYSINFSKKGIIELRASNVRFENSALSTVGWQPDDFDLYYTGNNDELTLKFKDMHGNRAQGTFSRR